MPPPPLHIINQYANPWWFLLAAAGFGISHPPPLATEPAGLAVWRIFCVHQTFDGFYTKMFSGFFCTPDRFEKSLKINSTTTSQNVYFSFWFYIQ
jgi:hypothetical protein